MINLNEYVLEVIDADTGHYLKNDQIIHAAIELAKADALHEIDSTLSYKLGHIYDAITSYEMAQALGGISGISNALDCISRSIDACSDRIEEEC